jgi:hypothetical protein
MPSTSGSRGQRRPASGAPAFAFGLSRLDAARGVGACDARSRRTQWRAIDAVACGSGAPTGPVSALHATLASYEAIEPAFMPDMPVVPAGQRSTDLLSVPGRSVASYQVRATRASRLGHEFAQRPPRGCQRGK